MGVWRRGTRAEHVRGGGGTWNGCGSRLRRRRRIQLCGGHRVRLGCKKGARSGAGGCGTERRGQRHTRAVEVGVELAQVVAARNGRGSAQEKAAVAESTRGGTVQGRGYSIEGGNRTGMAWRGRACSGRCGGGAMVTWQVRRGNTGVGRACVAP
ncbi:hypothetical protein B0H14DRAFT_2597736 [Mycena olivaceomarginata]|nr:hypothetical protein B0H14DRAFT_2597736 [Mycena olivaceomarginata]